MDNDYFAENAELNKSAVKHQKTVSIPTLIISLITTIVLVVIVVNNWNNVMEMFGFETEIVENWAFEKLVVWDEVKLSGDIFDDGDLVHYTHILDSKEYGEIWLKSQKINLNNYKDEIYLEGIVEKIQQGVAVIEVDTIYLLSMDDDTNEDLDDNVDDDLTWTVVSDQYLSDIWIYLDSDFFEKYLLMNEWEGWKLKIKNIETSYIISLDYFKCSTAIDNQNCERFNELFSDSSSQKFVTADGTNYYKQSEVQSWFFSNWDLFGFFANDVEDDKFKDLIKYIKLVNLDFVEENILDDIGAVCWEDGMSIEEIDTYSLNLKDNSLYLDIEGDDWVEDSLLCNVKIDPTLKNMAELIKFEKIWKIEDDESIWSWDVDDVDEEDDDENDENWDDDFTENFDWDSDVEQFPINLEKSLEFTSRRGHTIVFPSSNIAYAGKSVQNDFDQVGVNCFSVMNVVKYSEKESVNDKWSVKIYECSIKEWFDDAVENLIYKAIWDKNFVIEIVDPSWIKFANNINILIK